MKWIKKMLVEANHLSCRATMIETTLKTIEQSKDPAEILRLRKIFEEHMEILAGTYRNLEELPRRK